MKCLESGENRVWAARSRAVMDVWLGSLLQVPNLNQNVVSPCGFPKNIGGLLLTGLGTDALTSHIGFGFWDG